LNDEANGHLFLLGPARLTLGAAPARLARRKTLLLLAWLALHPKGQTRQHLAALLWAEAPAEAALLSLRVALSELRKLLGDAALRLQRNTVQLAPEQALWVDALTFEALAAPQRGPQDWQAALDLYSGDLLPEVHDDWVLPLRTRLAALHLQTLLRLARHRHAQADYAAAVTLAQRALQHDASEEAAHRQIMHSYEALGERAAALAQFDACAHSLRSQFGAEPSAQTQALRLRLQTAPARSDSLLAYRTNLPALAPDFFARAPLQQAMEEALAPLDGGMTEARLITLTGMGGAGKSRLALQVAGELVSSYADGVWWLDVSRLQHAQQLSAQWLQVCGLPNDTANERAQARLLAGLQPRHCLLLLDNCDALVGACSALVLSLLAACPQVQVLATSCEALGVPGEHIYRVPRLQCTQLNAPAAPGLPASPVAPSRLAPSASSAPPMSEALCFLAHKARRFQPSFLLDAGQHDTGLALCQQLDGLPLALELAAAQLQGHTLAHIAASLPDRFELLATANPATAPRQRSLWARLDACWQPLGGDERKLLQRLATYPEACTLEQVEALCADLGANVLDLLALLVDKSLLTPCAAPDGMPDRMHYALPNTLRQFALQVQTQRLP
jgi:predicted ATPase/DNA-binding SARP family transcriptional activator